MAYIYKITNEITQHIYVGQTSKTIEERFIGHKRASKYKDTHLYRAMRKYGIENFTVTLLEAVDEAALSDRERSWIAELNTMSPVGYNGTVGGGGGDTSMSPNYKAAMLLRDTAGENNGMYGLRGENNPNYGSTRTVEQCDNLRRGLQQAWDINAKRKAEQSQRMTGKNNPQYGKKPNSAMSVVFGGVKYDSLADAARDTGHSPQYIKKNGDVVTNE